MPRETDKEAQQRSEPSPKGISEKSSEWLNDHSLKIEDKFIELTTENTAYASQFDWNKAMCASVLAVLGELGFSFEELVDVLSSKEILQTDLLKVNQQEPPTRQQTFNVQLQNIEKAIQNSLETLASNTYRFSDACFETRYTVLFLIDSRGSLKQTHASKSFSPSSALLTGRHEFYMQIAALTLHEGTAISWNPKFDTRFQQDDSIPGEEKDIPGPLAAIRLEDWNEQPIGVVVFCSETGSYPKDSSNIERFLLDDLRARCISLLSQLQVYCFLKTALSETITGNLNKTIDFSDKIDQLYNELAKLRTQQSRKPQDPELAQKIQDCQRNLQVLQQVEAKRIEQHYLSHLNLPLETSANILRKADELIDRYANHTPADPASDNADDSKT